MGTICGQSPAAFVCGLRGTALAIALWGAALAAGNVHALTAQSSDVWVGVALGRIESEQRWTPPVATSARSGFLVGAFLRVPTPVSALRIQAEAAFVQRGSFVLSDSRDTVRATSAPMGEIRSEYLNVALQLRVEGSVGPVRIFAGAGPGLDYLVRSRQDAVLAQVVREEHAAILAVGAGAGAGVRVRGIAVELEGRRVLGLTDAWRGGSLTARNRSQEWIIRVGVPRA